MCTWERSSHCDLGVCLILPLRDIERRSCSTVPSLHFSLHLPLTPFPPSPAMQVPKLLPVPPRILCSRGLRRRAVPRRAGSAVGRSLGEAFLAGRGLQPASGAAGTTAEHRAPSVMVRVKRAAAGYCTLSTKLTCSCRCHALCYHLLSVITAVIFHIIISLALSISS